MVTNIAQRRPLGTPLARTLGARGLARSGTPYSTSTTKPALLLHMRSPLRCIVFVACSDRRRFVPELETIEQDLLLDLEL